MTEFKRSQIIKILEEQKCEYNKQYNNPDVNEAYDIAISTLRDNYYKSKDNKKVTQKTISREKMTNREKFKKIFGKEMHWSRLIEPQIIALRSAYIDDIDCMEEWLNMEYEEPKEETK